MRPQDAPALKVLRGRLFQQIRDLEAIRLASVTLPAILPCRSFTDHVATGAAAVTQGVTSAVAALVRSAAIPDTATPPPTTHVVAMPVTKSVSSSFPWSTAFSGWSDAKLAMAKRVKAVGDIVAGAPAAWEDSKKAFTTAVASTPAALAVGMGALGASLIALPASFAGETAKMAAEAGRLLRYEEEEKNRFVAETAQRDAQLAKLRDDYARCLAIIRANIGSYLENGALVVDADFRPKKPYGSYIIENKVPDATPSFDMPSLSNEQWQVECNSISTVIKAVCSRGLRVDLSGSIPPGRPLTHGRAAIEAASARVPAAVSRPAVVPALGTSRIPAAAAAAAKDKQLLTTLRVRVTKMLEELNTEWHIPFFDVRRAAKTVFLIAVLDILNSQQKAADIRQSLSKCIDRELNSTGGSAILAGRISIRTATLVADMRLLLSDGSSAPVASIFSAK